jgi:hypothetical protein
MLAHNSVKSANYLIYVDKMVVCAGRDASEKDWKWKYPEYNEAALGACQNQKQIHFNTNLLQLNA